MLQMDYTICLSFSLNYVTYVTGGEANQKQ